MSKLLWLDTETTGLDAVKNDVIQLAGIIEIDGEVMSTFEFECQPHSYANISQQAMDVNGYTRADLEKLDDPGRVKAQLEGLFSRYVNKFDKTDKFTLAGYNVGFDAKFMKQFWLKCGDKYWGSYVEYKNYDVYPVFQSYSNAAKLDLPNHKLVTAADHFGLDFGAEGAHDAMADIRVTREVGICVQNIFEMGIKCHKIGYTPDTLTEAVIGRSTVNPIQDKAEALR